MLVEGARGSSIIESCMAFATQFFPALSIARFDAWSGLASFKSHLMWCRPVMSDLATLLVSTF